MLLKDLARGLDVVGFFGNWDVDVRGLSVDSRKTVKGDVFCAVRGANADGRKYIPEALSRGAVAVLTDDETVSRDNASLLLVKDSRSAIAYISNRFYNNPSRELITAGVTGTNGKTTVSFLIKKILDDSGYKSGLIGTVGYFVGDRKYNAPNTTPDPIDLVRLISETKIAGGRAVVMEVSSHALDQKRADCLDFDIAVFTNLTRDHFDYHIDLLHYFSAKARIFTILNQSCKKDKTAVVNIDDPMSGVFKNFIKTKITTYGIKENADIKAKNIRFGLSGTEFDAEIYGKTYGVKSSLIGRFNVYNVLAGIAAGVSLKIEPSAILNSVKNFNPPQGRMQFVDCGQKFSVIVDYAHTDDALSNLLQTVREITAGRIYLVFGCGGDRDKTKRPMMGETARRLSDFTVITSDNPRSEDPLAIISDIKKGFKAENADRYTIMPDRREAIEHVLKLAGKNDAVVIAGKGHEDYQIIKEKILHFSDVEIVQDILKSQAVCNTGI